MLQRLRKSDVVDIFGIVFEMRKERVWMVQTEQQYICIHQVNNSPLKPNYFFGQSFAFQCSTHRKLSLGCT